MGCKCFLLLPKREKNRSSNGRNRSCLFVPSIYCCLYRPSLPVCFPCTSVSSGKSSIPTSFLKWPVMLLFQMAGYVVYGGCVVLMPFPSPKRKKSISRKEVVDGLWKSSDRAACFYISCQPSNFHSPFTSLSSPPPLYLCPLSLRRLYCE